MIVRQSSETTIPELTNASCERVMIVQLPDRPDEAEVLYIRLNSIWHKVVIHYGTLFWEGGEGPDAGDDLLDGEVYFDAAKWGRLGGEVVHWVKMSDNVLEISFGERSLRLQYYPDDDRVRFALVISGERVAPPAAGGAYDG